MQTKSVYQTIDTLLNMDVENYLLGSYLNGIISQRIIKKLCPSCRDKRPATKYEKTIIKKILHKDIEEVYFAEGCEDCRNGYIRQIPITEIVIIDDELRSAISNNKDHSLIRKAIYASNQSIIQDGLEKVIAGETSFEEIMRVFDIKVDLTDDDDELRQIILGNVDEASLDRINNTPEPNPQPVEAEQTTTSVSDEEKEETDSVGPIKIETDNNEETSNEDSQEETENTPITVNVDVPATEEAPAETKEQPSEETNTADESSDEDDDDDDDDFNYGDSYSINA